MEPTVLSLDVRIVESAPLFFVRATLDGGAAREFAARFEAFRELRNLLARLTPAPLPDFPRGYKREGLGLRLRHAQVEERREALEQWLAAACAVTCTRAFCPQMRPPARHHAKGTTRMHAAPESMEYTTAPGDVEAFRRALMRRLAGGTLVLADEDAPAAERTTTSLREAVRALRVRQREARGGLRGL